MAPPDLTGAFVTALIHILRLQNGPKGLINELAADVEHGTEHLGLADQSGATVQPWQPLAVNFILNRRGSP